MRITGGVWASRRVAGPGRATQVRPTPDFLREQAFAILAARLPGAAFLDLFAGTGINSLEALSRGAATALLVERAPAAIALIRRNFAALQVPEEQWVLVARDVRRALSELAGRRIVCPFAWCDPPFASWGDGLAALTLARELGVLPPGGEVVIEAPPKGEIALSGFAVVRELRGAFLLRAAG